MYMMEMTSAAPDDAIHSYYALYQDEEERDTFAPYMVRPFAEELARGVSLHRDAIDALITSASEHWRIERMSLVDRNVLRIAIYEMLHCPDIPPKVSINEAVELGKAFGTGDSSAFINGILDHIMLDIEGKRATTARKTS